MTTENIESQSSELLVRTLYGDLKRIARNERRKVSAPPTLQTTALIHEAYLKLRKNDAWSDQNHFMRAAANAMRQVLVDAARARLAEKRAGGIAPLSIEDYDVADESQDESLVSISDALEKLGELDSRLATVVECRFFAGFSEEETAQVLSVTSRTVRRDWIKAKAWLYSTLNPE